MHNHCTKLMTDDIIVLYTGRICDWRPTYTEANGYQTEALMRALTLT